MKFIKSTVVISGITLGFAVGAQAYQGEVEIGYSDGEIETVDIQSFDINAAYYFSPVDTGKGPLAEAAFLDRASSIKASFADGELEESGFEDVDAQSFGIEAHLVGDTGFNVSLGYSTSELEDSSGELDIDVISVGMGKYIVENGLLSLNYSNIEVDISGVGDGDADTFSIDYKHVMPADVSYSLEGSLVYTDAEGDSATGFIVGATIYPTKMLGLGISYSSDTVDLGAIGLAGGIALDDIDADALGLHVRFFATEDLSLALEYDDGEIEDVDYDALRLSLNYRF